MKLVQILLILLVALFGSLVLFGTTVGKNRSEVLAVSAYGARVWEKAVSSFASVRERKHAPKQAVGDEELQAALDELLGRVFLERSGFHFSRSLWGTEPVPYQFRGLQVGDAQPLPVSPADRKREIDRRVHFPIRTEAFRGYERPAGWGAWEFDPAPHLEGITFVRVRGRWQPTASPERHYSVR